VRWQPREAWFQASAPKLWGIAQRVKAQKAVQSVVARNQL